MKPLAKKVAEANGNLYIFSDQPKDGFRFCLMKGKEIDRASTPKEVEGVSIERDAKTGVCIGRKSAQKASKKAATD